MSLNLHPSIDITELSTSAIAISQQLFEHSIQYNQRCIMLLDPFLTPINDNVIDYFADKGRLHQICMMHPSILASKRPLLLELNLAEPFENQVLSYSIEQALNQTSSQHILSGAGQQYCAWLFSQVSVNRIANDIALLALQKTYQDKTLLLRFFDPAVFLQLMSILNEHQQHKLYGHIESWALINRTKRLVINRNIGKPRSVISGHLGLNNEQLMRLKCIGVTNQLLKKYGDQPFLAQFDECQILQRIMPCVTRLLDKKISDETLLIEWAKLALKYHQNFDVNPTVIKATAHFTIRYDYYRWLQSMTEQVWEQIVDDNRKEELENRGIE